MSGDLIRIGILVTPMFLFLSLVATTISVSVFAQRVQGWQPTVWLAPLIIGPFLYLGFAGVLGVFAAYRRFGLGDGRAPGVNYLRWGFVVGILMTAAFATERVLRANPAEAIDDH